MKRIIDYNRTVESNPVTSKGRSAFERSSDIKKASMYLKSPAKDIHKRGFRDGCRGIGKPKPHKTHHEGEKSPQHKF